MKSTLIAYIDRFTHDRYQRVMLGSVLFVLGIMVTLLVYWQLRYVGITMTNVTYCGYEEHVHTEECYEETLVCELEESEGHTHTEECYEEQSVLVCGLEESEGHAHTEECYDEEGNLICGLEESEGHTHTDECYENQSVLVCELEESEGHTHTDECYEYTLICGLEEHTHTAECMVDETADLEDYSIWEATIPALTGDLRTDVVNIAYSQLGYTESVANYVLGEDGVTHMGYTRYGTWYGSSYSDWDSMFVAFCLDHAGIADEFTYNAGAYAWSVDLTALGYYQTADVYTPSVGDVVFIDTDDDGKANVTAIVVAVDETTETITVIQGNYATLDSDGDTVDTVSLVTYSTAASGGIVTLSAGTTDSTTILGYANIDPETASEEVTASTDETSADETEEVVLDEETAEEITESVAEENASEEIASEESVTEESSTSEESAEEATEEVTEEESSEENLLLTSTATDYVTQVTELYSLAMTLTADDSETAATVWDELMAIWEQIYAEEDAGTLTLTDEEYDNIDSLTDEVYYYFVETVGYDPYGVATADDSNTITVGSSTYANLDSYAVVVWAENSTPYYSSSDGYIHVPLIFTFSGLTSDEITSNNYTFYLALPDGVTPGTVVGETDTSKWYQSSVGSSIDFIYMFFYDDTTKTYYIEIIFDEDDVYQDTIYDGYVSFEAIYSDTDENDQIVIEYSDSKEIVINGSDIKTEGNESWNADISVSKSASSYDVSTNSITYTVTVYSEKGTDGKDITLSDLLTLSGSGLTEEDITGITIDSITTATVTVTVTQYGEYEHKEVTYGTYEETTAKSTTTSDSGYSITLAGSDSGIVYKITYTVTFDPESSEIAATLTNTATASVDDKNISDTVTYSKKVSTSIVDKSGSYDGDETITWTITVNQYGSDIGGYIFYDDAFADATNLTVTSNSTTATQGTDWEYVYDDDNNIIGIQFLGDSNTNDYTITYTTTVSVGLGETVSVTNDVTVTDGKDPATEITTESTTVTGNKSSGNGSVTKTLDSTGTETTDSDGMSTRTLTWTSTITLPEDGISAGTEIYDYLGTYSGDVYSYTSGAGQTYQWFTYDQITDLFSQGLSIDGVAVTSSYTFYAYDQNLGEWISYQTLIDEASTYSSHLFTAYKIVFVEAVDSSGTLSLTYTTTANTTNVTTNRTYWNTIATGKLSSSASYTENNPVYKADGNGNTGTTSHYTSDGTMTWKIYIYVDENTSGDIVILDSIPNGVTVTSMSVAYGSTTRVISSITDPVVQSDNSTTWTSSNAYVTAATSYENKTTITISEDAYSSYVTDYGANYIIVTFTCSIDSFDSTISGASAGTTLSWTWTNTATVTIGSGDPTEVEQKQNIYYYVSSGTDVDDTVDKGYSYDSNNNILNFYVVINPDGEDLVADSDTIDFTDELTANVAVNLTYGWVVSLRSSTVKFYELIELTEINGTYYYVSGTNADNTKVYTELTGYSESDLYYADDGTVYYKQLLDIDWTYDTTYSTGDYIHAVHTISATLPDSTAIYVEYSYSILKGYENKISNALFNTATVTGGHSDTVQADNDYSASTTSASISTSGSLTMIKVDGDSFSTTLSGATFEIYEYVGTGVTGADDEGFINTGKTVTTGTNGSLTITMENSGLSVNTLYYLVESVAPDGYILDTATRYYFYWIDKDEDASPAYSNLPASSTLITLIGDSFYAVLSEYSSTAYAKNYESVDTSLGILKHDSEDADVETRLEGATYSLQIYEYDDTSGDYTWVDTGTTYTTNKNGRFSVSLSDGLTYNQAYRLVETVYPDGYEVTSTDQNEIYFWWSYSDTTTYPEVYPTGWSASASNDGSSASSAIDLADSSVTATVTNTQIPTTSVTVNKAWVNENGNTDDPASGAYAQVQLYYYLGDKIIEETENTINIYIGTSGKQASSESDLSGDSSFISLEVPLLQLVTITIYPTSSSWGNTWYDLYAYTASTGGDDARTTLGSGYKYGSDDIIFTTDSSYSYYQVVPNSIDELKIFYTDSESVYYEYTYTESGGLVQTSPASGGGTGGGTTDTYTYSDLTGVKENTGTLYSDTVYTISASDWSVTVEDLPKYVYTVDSNGKLVKQYYYYYFVEVAANGADVDYATYSQADGIPGSTSSTDDDPDENESEGRVITITNTVGEIEETYELPSAGGVGRIGFYVVGGMLIALAAGIFAVKKRSRQI